METTVKVLQKVSEVPHVHGNLGLPGIHRDRPRVDHERPSLGFREGLGFIGFSV